MDFKTLLSGFLENSPLVWNWLFCKRPYSFSVNGDSSRKKVKKNRQWPKGQFSQKADEGYINLSIINVLISSTFQLMI